MSQTYFGAVCGYAVVPTCFRRRIVVFGSMVLGSCGLVCLGDLPKSDAQVVAPPIVPTAPAVPTASTSGTLSEADDGAMRPGLAKITEDSVEKTIKLFDKVHI